MTTTLLFCLAASLGAADYESKNPLSEPENPPLLQLLPGIWKAETSRAVSFLFFTKKAQGSPSDLLALSATSIDLENGTPNRVIEPTISFATASSGDTVYINIPRLDLAKFDKAPNARLMELGMAHWATRSRFVKSYTFLKCRLEGRELTIWELDPIFIANAIILKNIEGNDTTVTASSKSLLKFLMANDEAAFPSKKQWESYVRFEPAANRSLRD